MSLLEPDALWQTVQRRLQRPGALGWLLLIPVLGGFGVALAAGIGVRVFDSANIAAQFRADISDPDVSETVSYTHLTLPTTERV